MDLIRKEERRKLKNEDRQEKEIKKKEGPRELTGLGNRKKKRKRKRKRKKREKETWRG